MDDSTWINLSGDLVRCAVFYKGFENKSRIQKDRLYISGLVLRDSAYNLSSGVNDLLILGLTSVAYVSTGMTMSIPYCGFHIYYTT